jgi:geranylgeranyl pyrophosphate synthase
LSPNLSFFTPSVLEGIEAVENLIKSQADDYHPDLGNALALLVSSGGKRVRPAITLLIGQMLNADTNIMITLGASIELLHTATLVHDDLIDESLLRRGTPTLNAQWTPGATVLTGDFLFAHAARLAAETNSVEVMKVFAKTLTIIVNGEITQLFSSRFQENRKNYYDRTYAKTASLFETSACVPSIVSSCDKSTIESMRKYGYEIGMAFQIIDDILDFTSNQTTLGKPVGSDLRQGLVTLPAIYYFETHPDDKDVKYLLEEKSVKDEEQISRLIEAIRNSNAIQLALDEASEFVKRGVVNLNSQPHSPQRKSLEDLAHYIVQRKL